MYLPASDGNFSLEGLQHFTTLDVEGGDILGSAEGQPSTSSSLAVSATRPNFKSVIAPKKGAVHRFKVRHLVYIKYM